MTSALYVLLGIAFGYSLARALWKRKADHWFTRAMEAEGERFPTLPNLGVGFYGTIPYLVELPTHPLGHRVLPAQSIDSLIHSTRAPREVRDE